MTSEPARTAARRALDAVWRSESARIVGALARYTNDFALAEDVAQEAVAEALVSWETGGVPANPSGWLTAVGRRRAIDAFRRRSARDDRYASLARDLDETTPGADALFDPDAIDDDTLALAFTACHPVLSAEARIALTLKVVGGLTTDEIAKAFGVPTATVQARITRAKKALGAAEVPFEMPDASARPERLGSVLRVVYLIFTEGSSATAGDEWMRVDLAREALRLARVLTRVAPEPEVFGLLALLELTAARFPARVDASGRPVQLDRQERGRWDRAAIVRGRAALARAGRGARPGNGAAAAERGAGSDAAWLGMYGLQAAIAERHAVAPSVAETDWARIVELYEALERVTPSPFVSLNRAVAVSMAEGPEAGLAAVDALADRPELARSHQLPAVRGELLARLGRDAEARAAYDAAIAACANAAERAALERKAAALARA